MSILGYMSKFAHCFWFLCSIPGFLAGPHQDLPFKNFLDLPLPSLTWLTVVFFAVNCAFKTSQRWVRGRRGTSSGADIYLRRITDSVSWSWKYYLLSCEEGGGGGLVCCLHFHSSRITRGIIPQGLDDDRMLLWVLFDQKTLTGRDYVELFTWLPRNC